MDGRGIPPKENAGQQIRFSKRFAGSLQAFDSEKKRGYNGHSNRGYYSAKGNAPRRSNPQNRYGGNYAQGKSRYPSARPNAGGGNNRNLYPNGKPQARDRQGGRADVPRGAVGDGRQATGKHDAPRGGGKAAPKAAPNAFAGQPEMVRGYPSAPAPNREAAHPAGRFAGYAPREGNERVARAPAVQSVTIIQNRDNDTFPAKFELEKKLAHLESELSNYEVSLSNIETAMKTIARLHIHDVKGMDQLETDRYSAIVDLARRDRIRDGKRDSEYFRLINTEESRDNALRYMREFRRMDEATARGVEELYRREVLETRKVTREAEDVYKKLYKLWGDSVFSSGKQDLKSDEYLYDENGYLFISEGFSYIANGNNRNRLETLIGRFNNTNRRELDPVREFNEYISNSQRKWTEKDKELFFERYQVTPKDFTEIAEYFEDKTTQDVIQYYYLNKKQIKNRLRELNMKREYKRRQEAKEGSNSEFMKAKTKRNTPKRKKKKSKPVETPLDLSSLFDDSDETDDDYDEDEDEEEEDVKQGTGVVVEQRNSVGHRANTGNGGVAPAPERNEYARTTERPPLPEYYAGPPPNYPRGGDYRGYRNDYYRPATAAYPEPGRYPPRNPPWDPRAYQGAGTTRRNY